MGHRIILGGKELGVWDLYSLTLKESFLIKAATGLDPQPLTEGLGRLDPAAWQAVVWFLRRKTEPDLTVAEVDFAWGDLDADEVEEALEVPSPEAEAREAGETSAPSETNGSTSSAAG